MGHGKGGERGWGLLLSFRLPHPLTYFLMIKMHHLIISFFILRNGNHLWVGVSMSMIWSGLSL